MSVYGQLLLEKGTSHSAREKLLSSTNGARTTGQDCSQKDEVENIMYTKNKN